MAFQKNYNNLKFFNDYPDNKNFATSRYRKLDVLPYLLKKDGLVYDNLNPLIVIASKGVDYRKSEGKIIIRDICDYHLDGFSKIDSWLDIVRNDDRFVFSSKTLQQIYKEAHPDIFVNSKCHVIDDPYSVETKKPMLKTFNDQIVIGWFGNGFNGNLVDWQKLRSQIVKFSKFVDRTKVIFKVLSNPEYFQRMHSFWSEVGIEFNALSFTEVGLDNFFRDISVVLIPVDNKSQYSFGKSHNRLIETIMAGKPTIAYGIEEYKKFSNFICYGEDIFSGLIEIASNTDEVVTRLSLGQKYIEKHFSPSTIAASWSDLIYKSAAETFQQNKIDHRIGENKMTLNIEKALLAAVEQHKKGNLVEATRIYTNIIKDEPLNVFANHNLGVILASQNQSDDAIKLFETALGVSKNHEVFWESYIKALLSLGKSEMALENIENAKSAGFAGKKFELLSERVKEPLQLLAEGKMYRAQDTDYIKFLNSLHEKVYKGYFEIGARTGSSLALSKSPSVAIDPYFQLKENPVGNKDFCLMFQETSDSFFENSLPKLGSLECELAFIDGMHLFEYALRDFLNLNKIASENSLFLFHDVLPWTFEMATRDNKALAPNAPWTGDIWKLVQIFIDAGMRNNIRILTAAPSGLLAVLNPDKAAVRKLEKDYNKICSKWMNVQFNENNLKKFYETDVFTKPEIYLKSLQNFSLGDASVDKIRTWVSQ